MDVANFTTNRIRHQPLLNMATVDLATFCQRLPKLASDLKLCLILRYYYSGPRKNLTSSNLLQSNIKELHAHLNGSLGPTTLTKLHLLQNSICGGEDGEWNEELRRFAESPNRSSLKECFRMFPIVQKLTGAPEYVRIAAEDVIKEFHQENVIYLELRSTPRRAEGIMSKREYVEAIIRAIIACETAHPEIMVKLLVSVDRKRGFQDARENIDLAIELRERYPTYVVGIDLSGDPAGGDAFIDLLEDCRRAGLKIAAHCAEVPNPAEVANILNFRPDRLGHCTCVHPNLNGSEELFEMLLRSELPVELCPTSNVKCGTVPNYESHQLRYLRDAGHPISISTDDKGIFATSLSKEYERVGRHLGVRMSELRNISRSTILYSFASPREKEKLTNLFDSMVGHL